MTFYVYQLVDPRSGLPFYVGKGQGQRAWAHQREVERGIVGRTSRKVDRIREILIAGHDVEVQIVADYDDEQDALDHEWRLIRANPTLTNIAVGGDPQALSPEQIEKRDRIREERLAARRARAEEVARASFVERGVQQYAGNKKTRQHAEAVKAWIESAAEAHGLTSVFAPAKIENPPARPKKLRAPNTPKRSRVRRGLYGRSNGFTYD